MAIANFIPEVWSAAILSALNDRLVFAQPGVVNRNYEGDIARAGDTVHITSFGDPGVRDYQRNTDITWENLDSDQQTLVIDQEKYFAFTVDDVDRRQALPGFVEESATGASYNLAAVADQFVAGEIADGVDSANVLAAREIANPGQAYSTLVDLRTRLTRTNTPVDGRYVVVPPEFYAQLLSDDRFIRLDASGTTEGLRNGQVGRAAGFDVIEANTVPEEDGTFTLLAGHSIAATYAEQILQTEALRLENQFGDGIRGLHVYGAKVTRPTNVARVDVEVTGGEGS